MKFKKKIKLVNIIRTNECRMENEPSYIISNRKVIPVDNEILVKINMNTFANFPLD